MEAWLKSLAEAALPPSVTRDLQEFSSTVWRDTTELAKEGLSMATSLASGGPAGTEDAERAVASPAAVGAAAEATPTEAAPASSASSEAAPGATAAADGRVAAAEGADVIAAASAVVSAPVAAAPVAVTAAPDGSRRVDAPPPDDDLPGWGDDEES